MQAILAQLADGEHLRPDQATGVMEMIASGQATGAQIASLITALRMKGETAEEITSFVKVLLRHAVTISPHVSGRLVDTCGTGGDGARTFNISHRGRLRCCRCRGPGGKTRQPEREQLVRIS